MYLNKTESAIDSKAYSLKICGDYKNNCHYEAEYQKYEWCYDNYINKGLSMEEMATLANVKVRTIEKWCNEKHNLNNRTYKKYAKINSAQHDLIIGSLLGDGHIDKRVTQPNFVVSHAENQKDYLFWKYGILKNLCHSAPAYYLPKISKINNKECSCQAYFRFNTRILNALIPYREMNISQLILSLNNVSLSVFILDDGYRSSSNWNLCVAKFSEEDKILFCNYCLEKFNLICWIQKDNRYITFNSPSSRKIDELILRNLPNDLDIIKYKIVNNHTTNSVNYLYVNTGEGRMGLSTYCRKTGWSKYEIIREYMQNSNLKEIPVYKIDLLLKRGGFI